MDPRALALGVGGEGGGAFGTAESRAAGGETPDAVTLRDDFNGTTAFRPVCEPELALCESVYSESGLLSVMRWGAPLDVLSVVSPMSESEKLVKVKSLMKEIASCAEDPRGAPRRAAKPCSGRAVATRVTVRVCSTRATTLHPRRTAKGT